MFFLEYKPPKQLRALFIVHYAPILLTILIGPVTAIYQIWELPIDKGLSVIIGLLVFLAGTIFYFRWEFFWHRTYHGQLVTSGVFELIRHPHYTSLIVIEFGLAFFFYSSAAIVIAVISVPLLIWSIFDEEKVLIKQYGDAYRNYMNKVPWRIVPRIF